MIKAYLNSFYKYRTLLFEFVKRDIKIRYRRSVLGLLWTLLNPLLSMIIITIVFSTLFKNNIENFPVYLMAGQTIFNFYSESTTSAMNSIITSSSLIKKIYIPKYLFPLSKILSTMINLIASFIALICIMLITGIDIKPSILLSVFPILYVSMFSFGMGLILSCIALFFRDTLHFYRVFITMLTYLTPLFYPIEILPKLTRYIVQMNPLTNIIEYMRIITLYGTVPPMSLNIICIIPCIISIVCGLWLFYNVQDKFILHM